MGWDAFATTKYGKSLGHNYYLSTGKTPKLKSKRLRNQFEAASEEVRNIAGSVDGLLSIGALDCSACAYALEEATGESVWTETPWSPEFVKRLNERAVWPETTSWDVLSAKAFLKVCAEEWLGVRFSF